MRMRFFASPFDQTANALRKANWRDMDAADYLQQLSAQDNQGATMALRCMQLQREAALEEDSPIPQEMLDEAERTNRVVIRERDLERDTPWSLHLILSQYSYRGVSCTDILRLIATPDKMGANLLHCILRSGYAYEASSWLGLLMQLLDRDKAHREQNVRLVYDMLNQCAGYFPSMNQIYRPVDLITTANPDIVNAYVDLLVCLASQGLSRQKVEALLKTEQGSLFSLLKKELTSLPSDWLLGLIASGFLKDDELKPFANHKEDLLSAVLAEEQEEERRQHLAAILDKDTPLGKLFNFHKAKNEYKALNIHHGFLKRAATALSAGSPPSSEGDDEFVIIEVTSNPATLYTSQKPQVATTSGDEPLVFANSSPKSDLSQ